MNRVMDSFGFRGYLMEYSIAGDGDDYVLIMHGGHSNRHEIFGVEKLVEEGFTVIIPSRPGYGQTSKEIGTSLAEVAEYYIVLLNHLKISSVHLIGISAGGPSGIYLTAKYPEKVKSLTLQSAVTKEWLKPGDSLYHVAQVIFRPPFEKLTWKFLSIFNNLFPRFIFKQMVPSFSTLTYDEVLDRMAVKDIEEIRKMNNRQSSGSGFLVDLSQTGTLSSHYMMDIRHPTLIIHSKHDAPVPIEHAHYAHAHIYDSTLLETESWGHLIWLGKQTDEVETEVINFLKNHRALP